MTMRNQISPFGRNDNEDGRNDNEDGRNDIPIVIPMSTSTTCVISKERSDEKS